MQSQVKRLYDISRKKERKILGLMSGTSLDGLDLALCKISGSGKKSKVEVLHFATIAYKEDFKTEIRKIFAQENISFKLLCQLNTFIGSMHAKMINHCIKKWKLKNTDVDLIASHGQTVYHAPRIFHKDKRYGNATLQIGDADHIAVGTGIITISDFRQKHIAAGGEGAPLATYGDAMLFAEKNNDVILLNIGGVSNFTFLDADGKIFSTDIGPGNNLMDTWVQHQFSGMQYDEDSAIAKTGTPIPQLVEALWDDSFFKLPFPKSTGPETFNLAYIQNAIKKAGIKKLKKEDVLATLNLFTAQVISNGLNKAIRKKYPTKIYTSGGGIHNPLLMQAIKNTVNTNFFEPTTVNPDAKEAVLFALLANECIAGANSIYGKGVKNFPAVSMGKISFPH